jgi:hypothetical protein
MALVQRISGLHPGNEPVGHHVRIIVVTIVGILSL